MATDPIHQFQIQPIVPLEIAGIDVSFTNASLWMMIAIVVAGGFMTLAMRRKSIVPGRLQVIAEMLYDMVGGLVKSNIGPEGSRYFPFIFTLFMIVLMGNILGLTPHSFTFTSHVVVTIGLALSVFFMVIIMGLIRHGVHFFGLFVPSGVPWFFYILLVPIEIVSYFARPMTHGLRLFANMMAGHIMLKVFAGFSVAMAGIGIGGVVAGMIPMAINAALLCFELLIAFLQAYVFAILACIYLKDTVEIAH